MKAVIQRSGPAAVEVEREITGSIEEGMVILLGVGHEDDGAHAEALAGKVARIRIFPDEKDIPNRSLIDTGLEALVISQFTLMADTRKGNRPGYSDAAPPDQARALYEHFVEALKDILGTDKVATGRFGAMMDVSLVNRGPYTLLLESKVR